VLAGLGIIASALAVVTPTAHAAGIVSISEVSSSNPVPASQALAYTITVTNKESSSVSGVTIIDTPPLGQGNLVGPGPLLTTAFGSCMFTSPQVTCTAPTLAAGQVWTVTITGVVTAAPGSTLSDTATVTGTDAAGSFSASSSTTTAVRSVVPPGFAKTQLAHGLKNPTVLAFAPNGDTYIGEQGGTILIYRNGQVLSTPLGTIPNVYGQYEEGLLGIALDPNYATNGYMYVSYTVSVTNAAGTVQQFSRLSRFTVQNGALNPATEKVYYQGNQVQNPHHPGNTVKIGPDGKTIWWSVGDNVPAISNAQTLTNIYGKILRFNLDGSIPADNPFVNVNLNASGLPRPSNYIYAYGLRNPFRFTFLPNGKAMTADTGSPYIYDVWESVDTIQAGGNYGWPFYSGPSYSSGYLSPTYFYGHAPADGAVSAIAAYTGSTFPSAYDHVVFVGDYQKQTIEAVSFDPTYTAETSDTVFDSAAGTIADLEEGPDGNLYYVSIFNGSFTEIAAAGPFSPTASATATPSAGGNTVNFSSAGSSDPYGAPLSYSWNFGDGLVLSTNPNPSHTYTANGTYTATLTVSNGTTSATSSTQVVVGHSPPSASIAAPTTYNAGDTINFSAAATDSNDGVLPGYAYSWKVDFYNNGVAQPSYYAEIPTPFYGPVTGTGGSFQIPTDPTQTPNTFYRITLTVTDSLGLQTVVTQDLHPNLTGWSTNANIAGAGYWVDGSWQTGPFAATDVVGVKHVLIGMSSEQLLVGATYRFSGWSDGSALADDFTSSSTPGATYTANYEPTAPSPWQSADVGSPLMPGTTDYSAASQTYYLDGSGADVNTTNDQFHYMYQTLNGDGTIVARVRYQTNSSPWAKAGVMIKQSTTAGIPFVDALVTPDVSPATANINGIGCPIGAASTYCAAPAPPINPTYGYGDRLQFSPNGSKTPASLPPEGLSPNKWVKLTRAGNNFTGYESPDGVIWTQIGIATITMTGPVTIGLFVTSHNIGSYSTAAFDNVQVTSTAPPPPPGPLPSPWVDTDVGSPAIAGSASYNNGVFTVNGAGTDIYGTSDQFNYAYQPVSAGGTMIARVTSQNNTSSNAKAGVMFKQSTTAGTNYILIAVAPSGVVKVQYDFNGSFTESTYTFPNVWMKLSYLGGVFTAYLSSDGVNWASVLTKTLTITDPMTTGLFVCSHNASALGTATFDNVSFTPGT
jgi:glucose/arabinose dehydrogenase/regulation of enolase protein 1 (concanavalin A-like superfamily)